MSSKKSYPDIADVGVYESTIQRYKTFTNYVSHQAELHASNVFLRYYAGDNVKTLSYAAVDRLVINLACKWATDLQHVEVVSYFGDHSIDYIITMLAVMKLRCTLFAISSRNSESAKVDLMKKTGSNLLLVNDKYKGIASNVLAHIPGSKLMTIPNFDIEALLKEPLNPNYKQNLNLEYSDDDVEKIGMIIHSSGSTSFPKPIHLSNRYLISLMKTDIGNKVLGGNDALLPVVPLFHLSGLFISFSVIEYGGSIIFLTSLATSPKVIQKALVDHNATLMGATPLIYEQMSSYLKEANGLQVLQSLKIAFSGGAPISPELGEWLEENNINIRMLFGTSETGIIMGANTVPKCKNWHSIRPNLKDANGELFCAFEINDPNEPSIKHLYLRAGCPTMASNVVNRPDGGHSTQDLYIEDPDFPGYYSFLGRRDDTHVLENGEKTNPIPMEATIREHPMIEQVAVLGHGRQCTSALIQLNREHSDLYSPEEIIEIVQASVKRANIDSPDHSKILPSMVKILPLSRQLPCTDKFTVMRKKAEHIYQDLVDKLYENLLEGHTSQSKTNTDNDSSTWTSSQVENFLVNCLSEILGVPHTTFKNYSQSVFDLGFDSLTAIQLRNRIAENFDDIGSNFLFLHPSIDSMRDALLSSKQQNVSEQIEHSYEQTQILAENYIKKASKDFPRARNSYANKKDKVVLLTGATGSVGSFMLHALLQDSTVEKVYCCVRGQDDQLRDRLVKALESRSIDSSLLNTDRVEVLPMRFNERFLGLTKKKYYHLKRTVTIVQHCAWLLDFNMPVDHFDKECIQPFYNLLKFAYKKVNPMHVHFVSSISASVALGAEIDEAPLPFNSSVSLSNGYAQSKFIVEILFNYLTTEKNIPCYIERLGQVCGDSINGIWNVSEQYPLMFIGGGSMMRQMPKLDTAIDWITVDYAAASIVTIMLSTAYLPANVEKSVYHIVNPQRIMWTDVLDAMRSSGLTFDVVEPKQWVQNLAKNESNPAFRLLLFYQQTLDKSFQMPIWKTDKTSALVPDMSKSPVLNADLFNKFLAHWKDVGFYSTNL